MINKQSEGSHFQPEPQPRTDISFLNEISTATLVKLLVTKGILTASEILETEQQSLMTEMAIEKSIHNHLQRKPQKRSPLRRWAAKHRWSRRLTTRLLGWEWKKNKHYHPIMPQE